MGAYLSEPVCDVDIEEYNSTTHNVHNIQLSAVAATMQGWRISQEDAHNCILEFDKDMSLFAVYDGHGGAEVAKYCAQSLPDYIKSMDAYKEGDYVKALEEAFLGFDATITQPETIKLLKTLKNANDDDGSADSGEFEDEEEIDKLYKEAALPLKAIMAKYMEKKNLGEVNGSEENEVEASGSSKIKIKVTDGAGCSSSKSDECEPDVSSSNDNGAGSSKDEPVSTSNGKDTHEENDVSVSEKPAPKVEKSAPDSSDDSCTKATSNVPEVNEDCKSSSTKDKEHCNGGVSDTKVEESKEGVSSSSQENGKTPSPSKKGKALAKTSSGVTSSSNSKKSQPRRDAAAVAAFYNTLLTSSDCDDEEDSDSADETFHTHEEESDSDNEEAVNGDRSSEDGEENSEEAEDESDEDAESAEYGAHRLFEASIKNEPGSDSGCTAVIGLLHNDKLYVANAGDSRCIVCREGLAVDMSIDHKPEDEPEMARIEKAGGKVTSDGRVNDGLNLSRAIGDHGYKQNKELGPKDQMITAFPDIKELTIDPAKDEFMVLACDGIWNSMTSQAVVEFVKTRLDKDTKLTDICKELFDHCLAPSTVGDGTGCDNMTAIIVKFNTNNKRVRETEDDEICNTKRAKSTEEETPR